MRLDGIYQDKLAKFSCPYDWRSGLYPLAQETAVESMQIIPSNCEHKKITIIEG